MNNVILTLDQHEIDSSISADERESYYIRKAVRAVLEDDDGQVALMHAKQRNYYKLPGGGVDEGESLEVALDRELVEETGSTATVTKSLGEVLEWRDFQKMKQISYAYKATLNEKIGDPDFTQSEIDEGFELRWIDGLDEAIKLVETTTTHTDVEVTFMSRRDAAILRSAI